MNFEKVLSDIYSERKEYIIPFILGFPAVYAVFAFTPELAQFSYFDRVVLSLATEIAFHSVVISVLHLLHDWRPESIASMASANIYAAAILYGVNRLLSWSSSVPLFFLFLLGAFIVDLLLFLISRLFRPRPGEKFRNAKERKVEDEECNNIHYPDRKS